MVRRTYGLALAPLAVVLTWLVTPARGGYITEGSGVPNLPSAYSLDRNYVVNVQGAVANALSFPFGGTKFTPEQIIQFCMNTQLSNAGQLANWPMPILGDTFPNLVFTLNTPANPKNYGAVSYLDVGGAVINITTQNWPAGEHRLQLVHLNYVPEDIPVASMWTDPNGNGYWIVDNKNTPGQPFYDFAFVTQGQPPIFYDQSTGPWNGTSFFTGYLFVADMDAKNVITLHDVVTWGWTEPEIDPAPEPSSLTLILVGSSSLGLLCCIRRGKVAA